MPIKANCVPTGFSIENLNLFYMANASLMTKEEACVFLQISAPTLDRWMRLGLVTPLKFGKAVRFSKECLANIKPLSQKAKTAQ